MMFFQHVVTRKIINELVSLFFHIVKSGVYLSHSQHISLWISSISSAQHSRREWSHVGQCKCRSVKRLEKIQSSLKLNGINIC